MEKFIKTIFFLILLLLITAVTFVNPARAQKDFKAVFANLWANGRLHDPDKILSDFLEGKDETAVIVLLQPTAAANALAGQSKLSVQVPARFLVPEAPTYYNLHDESIKRQLKTTVKETVDRFIDRLDATGIKVTQRFSYQFGFAAVVTPAALEQIVHWPDVVTVEKDSILHAHLAQGIPLINAANVRNTFTGSGLSIAICDTGIDTSHPRLGGGGFPNSKVIGGYDTGDNDADPRPDSTLGSAHGTACAGIAAGDTGTVGDYIGGVAPGAKLYAVKISIGNSGSSSNSAMIAGWEWVITHQNDDPGNPIMIISTSFGAGRYYSACDSAVIAMTTAAANAVAAGITIFASSGNDGYCDSMGWPACISFVNSVGAVYDEPFGVYQPCVNSASCATKYAGGCSTGYYAMDDSAADKVTSYSNSASFLTLFAPSNQAYTTDIVGSGGSSSGDYYASFGGTSAACPYAAGSAAVLQQAAKAKTGSYLTPAQVKTHLVDHGDLITDSKAAVTKPRINLGRAVDAIIAVTAPTATTDAAGGVTATGAILNGTVNANNASTTVIFQYGLTTAYGSTVTADQSPVTGTSNTAVSKTITGLTPNMTYHYRVVGSNSAGTTNGGDLTFTTNDILALVVTPTLSSGKFDGTGDYLTVFSDQHLTNGSFETWTAGDNSAPDGWIIGGPGAAVAKEAITKIGGTYAAKLTRNGADAYLSQQAESARGHDIAYWKGRTVTFGCWVYQTVASSAVVGITDGFSMATAKTTPLINQWAYLTVTQTFAQTAVVVQPYLQIHANDTTVYFDGAFLTDDAAAGFNFGTDDFTIDTRIRLSTQVPDDTHMVLYSQYDSDDNFIFVSLYKHSGTGTVFPHVYGYRNGVNFNINTNLGSNLLVDTWYHIEISRENGAIFFFLDGIEKPTNSSINPGIDLTFEGEVRIGAENSRFYLNGYLDEFRVSKGIARHNASFTPPATIETADTYTELLLHFDGEEASTLITDSSAAARPVTARGNAKISRSVYPLLYLPVNEGGSNSNITVRLNAQPPGNTAVTVSRTAGDADLNVTSGAILTFTPANWSAPQTVTISAAQDADYTNGTATFTVDSTGLASQTVLAMEVDDVPPTPDPMTYAVPPAATSGTAIAMTATTATDADHPPVSYFFDFVDSTTGGTGGTDSAWQGGTGYTNSGLQANHRYGYRVKARDNAATPAETGYSATVYKYTLANAPVLAAYSGVTQTAIQANWTANGNRTGTEYYAENTTRSTNSGWVTVLLWNETGLTAGTAYTYRVKARNGDGIETGWTSLGAQSTQTATPTPPAPNPMTFAVPPAATSSTAIAMTATTATDADNPPVSYFFDFVDSTTGGTGGADSAWQAGAGYTNSGLQANHRYGYRVKARDNAGTPAETGYSATFYKYTLANVPVAAAFSNISSTTIQANWTANGNRTGTEYYGENTTRGTNSGWATTLNWNEAGLTCNTGYAYRVKARNGEGIETGWTSLGSQTTSSCSATPPAPDPMTFVAPPTAASSTSINMTAATATDADNPPVSYFFDFVDSTTGGTGGADSAWQAGTGYTNNGLQANHRYGYRVKARDNAATPAETAFSITVYKYTLANAPVLASYSGVTQTAIQANWTGNGNRTGTQYYVENTTKVTNSGWITALLWNETGLTAGTAYTYRVKARNGDLIETGWTSLGSQSTQTADTTAPTPSPMTWAVQPVASSATAIAMTATTATDATTPPVSYFFDFVDSTTGGTGGADSAWQAGTGNTNSGLQPNHRYGYRVKARDNAPTPNETGYSATVYKYTLANAPVLASYSGVTQTAIQANWTANGNRTGTEYYAENTTRSTNSGWVTALLWNETGLTAGTDYTYRVKARNGDGIETGWISLGTQSSQTATPTPPTPDPMTFAVPPAAASSTSITMTVTTATDADHPPVSYYFDFVDSTTGGTGGTDSAWQSGTRYTDSGLQANHRYGYRVKARDNAATPAETGYSGTVYRYTLASAPGTTAFSNISSSAIRANWTANGNRTGTEYYCENTTAGTNSGWITNAYWDSSGLTVGTAYAFRVKARNGDLIETGWTDLGSQSTFVFKNQLKNSYFINGLIDWLTHFNPGCGGTRTADVIWDTLRNSSILRLKSILAGNCGGSSGVLQNLNLNLLPQGNMLGASPKSVFLQLDLKIISATTPNICGSQGQEAPGQIALTYLPTEGNPKQLIFSFYYPEPGMTCDHPAPLTGVTYVPVQVQQGTWTTFTSLDLKNYVTDMETITAIDVVAVGRDYEAYFDNIELLVQQDSNVRLFLPLIKK